MLVREEREERALEPAAVSLHHRRVSKRVFTWWKTRAIFLVSENLCYCIELILLLNLNETYSECLFLTFMDDF